jgi:hypothetical protein|uniref:Uncharacterized protein n=1 Tax=Siphoviridae sp. cteLh2 TaxID=2825590 RepID=A0A8S5U622_9CAUD|nr:hypothetical protein [uncultured Lachnoclostridium sp.]DAF89861.1 MAG TPA: hypothetical protein [Siphoviridae sp. cteLh2]
MIRRLQGKLWEVGKEEIEGLKSERLALTESELKGVHTGSTFYEIDTKDKYMWESSTEQWYKQDSLNYTHPSTHPATMITEDTTHRFVTDAEKAIYNGKQDKIVAQNAIADLLSEADLPTVITTVNSMLSTLRTVGIIKNS